VQSTWSSFKEFEMSARATRLALVAMLPIVASPLVSFAGPTTAIDACVQSFLTTEFAKDRKVTVRTENQSVPRPLALSGLYRVEVVAKGRESGQQLARIVCHADAKGTIVAVNGRPVSAVASVAFTR
jgi:hypothetical protein